MAPIILTENLVNAMDNGKCGVGIFLDFQKAFDTVDHCILLDKLYFYGIRGLALDWFSSYLHDRQQLVNYCGCESDLKRIKCGVPQGSIIGPLLFLLYINDSPQASEYFMTILFADDTNLFATGYNLNDIISQINKEIDNVYAWVKANKLSLNIDITSCMLFTPKCVPRTITCVLLLVTELWKWLKQNFSESSLIINWTGPHILRISAKKLPKVSALSWKRGNYLTKIPYWHCIIHLFIRIWITVYMYGVKLTMFISMISLSCKIRLCA